MSILLFIQLPRTQSYTAQSQINWQRWDNTLNCALNSGHSSVAELRKLLEMHPANSHVLIVRGEQVRSITVTVPNTSKAALRTVPFQLEEHLSSKLETLHIVSAKAVDNHIRSLVCEHSDMQRWQSFSTLIGLELNYLVADFTLLPNNVEIGSVYYDGNDDDDDDDNDNDKRILINSAAHQGVMTTLIYERYKQQIWTKSPQPLNFYTRNDYLALFPKSDTQAHCDLMIMMATNFKHAAKTGINLLQGQYQKNHSACLNLSGFKGPILATLLLAVTLLALAVFDNYQLEQKNQQLKQQMVTLYKQLFPRDRRIEDPYPQMRGKLKQGTSSDGQHFLSWLAKVSPILNALKISLVNLKYDSKPLVLRLQVQARDYNALETLAQQINALSNSKLQASLGTLQKSSLNNKVTSLLTLREK